MARTPAPLGYRADLSLGQHACRTTRDHERLVPSHDATSSWTTPPRPIAIHPSDPTLGAGRFSSPENMTWYALRRFTHLGILRIWALLGVRGRSAVIGIACPHNPRYAEIGIVWIGRLEAVDPCEGDGASDMRRVLACPVPQSTLFPAGLPAERPAAIPSRLVCCRARLMKGRLCTRK